MKKLVSYKIKEDVVELFQLTSAIRKDIMSQVVEQLIINYIEEHKEQVQESLKRLYS